MYEPNFQKLLSYRKDISLFEGILQQIEWDREVCLPSAGHSFFACKRALLEKLIHEKKTAPWYEEKALELQSLAQQAPSRLHRYNIDLIVEDIQKAKRLPNEFVERFSRATSRSCSAWETAKATNCWNFFEQPFEEVVKLAQEKAKLQLHSFMVHPYESLLDDFEPGLSLQELDTFLKDLAVQLPPLYEQAIQKAKPVYPHFPSTYDQEYALASRALALLNMPYDRFRLDCTEHPATFSLSPNDVRISINKKGSSLIGQLLTALHEAGHALYDLGLDSTWFGTPKAESASMGVHESQSRFFELCVGTSLEFCSHLLPALHEISSEAKQLFISSQDIYNAVNSLKSSLIRVEANEIQYPLHIYVRYLIEKELIEGSLLVKHLPERWQALMQQYIGIAPNNDREGCLQDIHWSLGLFGYFPSYALGTAWSYGLQVAMEKESGVSLMQRIQKKDFYFIISWLSEKVWSQGRLQKGPALMKNILGEQNLATIYIQHLKEKFLG